MSNHTVTFTVAASDAHWVRNALVDSAIYWHHLYQDVMAGRRQDLTADGCLSINRRAQRLYDELSQQEMEQAS